MASLSLSLPPLSWSLFIFKESSTLRGLGARCKTAGNICPPRFRKREKKISLLCSPLTCSNPPRSEFYSPLVGRPN